MRWRGALRKEVVDLETAETIGKVRDLILDLPSSTVSALVVDDLVLDWSQADGIGRSVVTVERASVLREPTSQVERDAVAGTSDPLSKPVFTEDGFAIGKIGDVEIDAVSGQVERLLLGDDEVRGSRLIGVGTYAAVLASSERAAETGGLDTLPRLELHGLAEDRGIPDRATMTRQALIAALS